MQAIARPLSVATAMVLPTIGALIYFVLSSDSIIGKITYGIDKVFLLVFPALATYLWFRSPSATASPPEQPRDRCRSLLIGIASGAAIAVAIFALMASPLGDLVRASAPNIAAKANSLGFAQHYLLFSIFLSVFHSAIEEYYWRWFVYRRTDELLPGRPVVAHLIAAVAFAAHHLVILWQFFPPLPAIAFSVAVGLGGAIWSLVYRRTNSLFGPWVSHMIVDFALMAVGHQLITAAA